MMAPPRNPGIPPLQPRSFASVDEIDDGIAKLRRRIEDVEKLKNPKAQVFSQTVKNVQSNIRQTILEIFGENSPEFREHRFHEIWVGNHFSGEASLRGLHEAQRRFEQGIPETTTMLEGLIARLEENRTGLGSAGALTGGKGVPLSMTKKVFLVHGRDEGMKQTVARVLERLGLEAIILHERPSEGRTVIEKIEEYSDVGYAVVLLTADDRGGLRGDSQDAYRPRARQNVILELGFFLGKLGRRRVCPLYEEGVELPSDYQGVVYVPLDAAGAWKVKVAQEMKAAGLDVDFNKLA